MTTTTGKQAAAAAAAKTLLADRIALVETLGTALDTHRRAEQAVTTARTTAATAQHARDAYDAAKTGGWTAAELTKAGLRAPATSRTRTTKTTTAPHDTGSEAAADGSDNTVAGAA